MGLTSSEYWYYWENYLSNTEADHEKQVIVCSSEHVYYLRMSEDDGETVDYLS
jgi:hypothetical protein